MNDSVLTKEQVEFYRGKGYLLYKKPLFNEGEMAELSIIIEEQLAEKGSKLHHRKEVSI